jgi:hypothetical protein
LWSFGLELREELISEGKQLLQSMGYTGVNVYDEVHSKEPDCFIHANGLEYDYKDFDILYFYCPLCKTELQAQLEAQIAKTAKVGAILIPVLSHGCFMGRELTPGGWKEETSNVQRYFIREA